MENNETAKTTNKTSKTKIILSQFFYWLLAIIIIFYFRNNIYETTEFIRNILLAIMIFIALSIDVMLILFKKFNLELHKQFIVLAIVLGIFYYLATPFGNGTDEVSHFLRVFKISQKYTNVHLQEDSLFPPAFSKLVDYKDSRAMKYENYINEFDAFSMNSEERKDLIKEYWNIKLYSPIQYIPQVIGVTIGRIFSDNIVVIGMCGRVTGYIFWVALCALAIKIIPNKKTFLLILCLLPVNIFSAICISGDTVTNAVCMLFIALIYRKMYLKEHINKKGKILLFALACMIALCKIVYLPFVTLLILLKENNFDSKKDYLKFIVITIIASVIVGFSWLIIGSMNLVNSNSLSKDQLYYILTTPLGYFTIVIRTILDKGDQFVYQLCTGHELMCHAKTTVYAIVSYTISICLVLSLFINDDEKKLEINSLKKSWVGLIIFGTCLLIVTAIYIQWTSLLYGVAHFMILGIQGRYFIPVVALLIFILTKSNLDTNKRNLINTVIILQIPVLLQIMACFI